MPDALTVTALVAALITTLMIAIVEGADIGAKVTGSSAGGAALLAAPLLVLHLMSPAAMGFGDVKAGVALGAAIGLIDAWSAVVALGAACALTWVVAVIGRQHQAPFGPGLVLGSTVALMLARARGLGPVG